jgi:hypothetical protein
MTEKGDENKDHLVKNMHTVKAHSNPSTGHRRMKFIILKWKAYWKLYNH